MTPDEERAYIQGQQTLLRRQLADILRELGVNAPEWSAHRWVIERSEAIAALRSICSECGDNEWPDDLNLSDVIEKHLARHLRDAD